MFEIRSDDPTAPYVAALLTHHLAELREGMEGFAFALDASALKAPEISFWTAWRGDRLAGFGALRELDSRSGEVKSMRAAQPGSGAGRALLNHIIAQARARAYQWLNLETGTAALYQPAVGLYRSAGFVACDAFGSYQPSPHNQFFRLDL